MAGFWRGGTSPIGYLYHANMSVTTDQPICISADRYRITEIIVSESNYDLSVARGGIYTGPNKTGISIVNANQSYKTLTQFDGNNLLVLTLTPTITSELRTENILYLSLSTPETYLCYANIYIFGELLY